MQYGVIGEDRSDVDALKHLIYKLSGPGKLPIVRTKGFDGSGELRRRGRQQLELFARENCHRFVVCFDSDRASPAERLECIINDIIKPAGIDKPCCALVPVQELEAWILADLPAVTQVIPTWVPTRTYASPENIVDPKEHLQRLSGMCRPRPLYSNRMHNPRIVQHLDLDIVYSKCASFRPLVHLVQQGMGNV